jgi:hypothetical protein
MDERRQFRRQRSLLGGRILFNRRASSLPCVVRDLTERGARIDFPDSVCLPQWLDLEIDRLGLARRARIVWRSPTSLGVTFPAPALPRGVISLADYRREPTGHTSRD